TKDVDKFIEYDQIVITAAQFLDAQIPGVTSSLTILVWILRIPGESITHRVHFDAEFLSGYMFAVAIVARLHELNHAALQSASGGAHEQSQCSCRLTLTVAGVHHQ